MKRERGADRGEGVESKSVRLGEHAYCSRAVIQTKMLHLQTGGCTPRGVGETYNRTEKCGKMEDPPLRLPS